MLGERSYALSDCFNGALGSIATLGSQEIVEAGHVQQGWLRPP
jgi:hypothetical protein